MKRPYNPGPREFTTSRLILCEGPDDRAFFRELINNRELPACDVWCSFDLSGVAGRAGFTRSLFAIRSYPNFQSCREIIIVTDSDHEPTESFLATQDLIAKVEDTSPPEEPHSFVVPKSPHVREVGSPDIAILMIPWHDREGSLETLCCECAHKYVDAAKVQCVEEFANCVDIKNWPPQKRDKFRLRVTFASCFAKNPNLGLTQAWEDAPSIMNIKDSAFDQISKYLAEF